MGCDIHTLIEVYDDKEKKWVLGHGLRKASYGEKGMEVPYADRFTDRNYILFGLLTNGNVRGRGYGIFEPKGIPKDVSEFTKSQYDAEFHHTPSYLTWKEIEENLIKKKGLKIKVSGMIQKDRLKLVNKVLKKKDFSSDELSKVLYPYCQMTTQEDYIPFEISVPIGFEIERFIRYMQNAKSYQWGYSNEDDKIRIVFWFDN